MANDNNYMARYMADRYLLLKIKAIEYKGGKCIKCGYDKCYAAFDFHHRNPLEKEFSWHFMRRKSWDTIKTELDKCDLLCANCHRETHLDNDLLELARSRMANKGKSELKLISALCSNCHKQFEHKASKPRKYCSHQCASDARILVNWPDNLQQLVSESSKSAVGRMLGVSANAVYKRLKNHHNT